MRQHTDCAVLIVEDDADIRHAIAELLRDEGYTIYEAAHGGEAFDLLHADKPVISRLVLILLDLMMPVMNGREFRTRQLQDPALAQVPVVVITGVHNPVQEIGALKPAGYLSKPIRLDTLLEMVGQYC